MEICEVDAHHFPTSWALVEIIVEYHVLLLACGVDGLDRLSCLVFGIYKWQSHLPKMLACELRYQAVAERLGRNASLVRQKEYGTLTHMLTIPDRDLLTAMERRVMCLDCPFPHD